MSIVAVRDNFLVVGLNSQVIFINKEGTDSWTAVPHEIDRTLPLLTGKPQRFLAESESLETEDPPSKQDESLKVQNVAVLNDELLAVSVTDKTLFLFEINKDFSLAFKSRRKLARNTSALKFFPDGVNLLVSDKTGDVFLYDCQDVGQPGRWLLGHISQVLDITVDLEQKYILSSDRDEKIRVTRFPETFEIEAFCLGHREFVSSIEVFRTGEKQYLMSGSGDCLLKVWDFVSGTKLHEVKMESPIGKICIRGSRAAVLLRRPDKIQIYSLSSEVFGLEKESEVADISPVVAIDFTSEGSLFVLFLDNGAPKVLKQAGGQREVLDVLKEHVKQVEFEDALENLYKKKIDNISDYHEKKRRRIEESRMKIRA